MSAAPCAAGLLRGEIRRKKSIPGSLWGDFFHAWCFPCCTVAQEALELQSVGYLINQDVITSRK